MRSGLLLLALIVIASLSWAFNAYGWFETVGEEFPDSAGRMALAVGAIVAALMAAVEIVAVLGAELTVEALRTKGQRWRPLLGFPIFVGCVVASLWSGHQAFGVVFDLDAAETRRTIAALEVERGRLTDEDEILGGLDINSEDPAHVRLIQRSLNRLRPELGLPVDGQAGAGTSVAFGQVERQLAEAIESNREALEDARARLAEQEERARIFLVILLILESIKNFGRVGFVIAKTAPNGPPREGEAQPPARTSYSWAEWEAEVQRLGHEPSPPPGRTWRKEPPSSYRPNGRVYLSPAAVKAA